MTQAANNGQLTYAFVGLDAIGGAFGRSHQTARRWINEYDFPACRLPNGAWCTTPDVRSAGSNERKAVRSPVFLKLLGMFRQGLREHQ